MAWGYEASFTIEHDDTLKRKICCKDCDHYDATDLSCSKRPLYLPEDGYNSWRNCDYFELNEDAPHYAEKKAQLLRFRNSRSVRNYSGAVRNIDRSKTSIKPRTKRTLESPVEKFARGDAIKHKVFGYGVVQDIRDGKIIIRFTPGDSIKSEFEKTLDLKVCINNGLITKVKTIKYEDFCAMQSDEHKEELPNETNLSEPKLSETDVQQTGELPEEDAQKKSHSVFGYIVNGIKRIINRIKRSFFI
ncbi:hypothetical protein SAMN06296386_106146 [Lachnospiraceae bacterium]|nr:hypothetical protein SAMN06296386_106146 [Lachnospiraceae bacterium]